LTIFRLHFVLVCEKMIVLKVKMPSRSFEIEIEENGSIVDLRRLIAEKENKQADQLVLIFGGKILKDAENLETHQIKGGMSVHLVIKQARQVTLRFLKKKKFL